MLNPSQRQNAWFPKARRQGSVYVTRRNSGRTTNLPSFTESFFRSEKDGLARVLPSSYK